MAAWTIEVHTLFPSPDERDAPSLEVAVPALGQRLHVGQRLARMFLVREGVDHRQLRRRTGNFRQPLLGEGADHDGADPSLEVAGDIVERLAIGVHHISRNLDDVAAQLADADRERHPGPERRLFEQQPDVPAGKGLSGGRGRSERALLLDPRGEVDDLPQLGGREVQDREEVSRHVYVRYSALIFTYSAVRSHVHTVAVNGPPVPRSTSISRFVPCRYCAA